jgi:hypothetical protein
MSGLFHDAHVETIRATKLRVKNFRQPGSLPPLSDYPGE